MSTEPPPEVIAAPDWVHVYSIDEMQQYYLSRLDAVRGAARECGYAIGQHGSMRRDMDLIAVPWADEHSDADTLAQAVQQAACGFKSVSYHWEQKPWGRIATSFPICWTADCMGFDTRSLGCIDLSIMGPSQ